MSGTAPLDDWIVPEAAQAAPADDWIVPDAPAAPAAPQPTFMQRAGRAVGLGVRDVIEGAPGVLDMLNNAGAAIGNLPSAGINAIAGREVVPEPFRYGVIADAARGAADRLGLPRPETAQERVQGAVQQGAVGMMLPYGVARALPALPGAAGQVVEAFRNSPTVDAVAGAIGGGAQGVVQEAGGGDAAGLGANLAGNAVGAAVTAAIIAAVARRRGVSPSTITPESIAPDEATLAWADPDVQAVARANGIAGPEGFGTTPQGSPQEAVLRDVLARRRAAELERAGVAPSVTEADLRGAREATEGGADPSAVAPPVRQPPPETIALPDQSASIPRVQTADGARVPEPPLRGTPDPNAVAIPPERLRSEDTAAREAFDLAEAQRQRMTQPNTRDTQPAGVRTDEAGNPVAETARTGQDFVQRSRSPDPTLPRQTYRYTPDDPNVEFPGAERGTGPDGGAGRTPFPDQAEIIPPARSDATPPGRTPPTIDPEVQRLETQIGRLTARGEPAAGTPPAEQLARLRGRLAELEGPRQAPEDPAGAFPPGDREQASGGAAARETAPPDADDMRALSAPEPPRLLEGPARAEPSPREPEVRGARQEGAEVVPEQPRQNEGGGTLYANPLGDPAAWRRFVGEPLRRAASKAADAGQTIREYGHAVVSSSDGQQRVQAAKYGERAPTYTRVLDMLHSPAGEADRAVGRTFSEAVSMRTNQRVVEVERLVAAIKADGVTPEQVVQAVVLPGRNRNPKVTRHADAVRALLRDELRYMREAGVDVGDRGRTYFPREFDVDAITRDERGFLARATAEYMRADGPNMPRAQAEQAAAALLTDVKLGGGVARLGGDAPALSIGNFTAERVFAAGAEAPDRLGRYYAEQDMESALASYMQRAAKRAEIARRFGDRFTEWEAMKKQLLDEGVSAEDVNSLQAHVEAATGVNHANMSRAAQNAIGLARTLSTMGQLDQSVIINLSELLMAGVRTGRLDDSMVALGRGLRQWGREIAGLKRDAAAELTQSMGIIAGHGHNAIMAARFAAGDPMGRWQEKQLAAFFKRIGLEQLTNATRIASTQSGRVFLDRLAAGALGESALTSPQRAKFFLRELGVPDAQAADFARFVRTLDDQPAAMERGGPMAELYQTALGRFVDQTVMRPDSTTRPRWAAHPIGAAIFTLNSYTYAFTKNVLLRSLKLAKEGATGSGYSPIDRVAFMAPLMLTLPVFAAGQVALQQLRQSVMGGQAAEDRDRRMTDTAKVEEAVKQSGLLGGSQMWIDIATSGVYGRDMASGAAGPVFGLGLTFADTLGTFLFDNSPRTNTAERNLARDAYRTIVEPGANVALGMMPGGGMAGAAARTAATYAIGARPTQEAVTEALVGPPDPRTQRRQRRQPIKGVTERIMEGR